MFFPLRSSTACVLLAFYSLAAALGEGLHDWTCSDHDRARAAAHSHDAGHSDDTAHSHDAAGTLASMRVVEAAGDAGHDPDQCPICQYRAQGQLSLASHDAEFCSALSLKVPCEHSSPSPRPVHQPYGPRAPPPVRVTVV
jgi:hypothetical protein